MGNPKNDKNDPTPPCGEFHGKYLGEMWRQEFVSAWMARNCISSREHDETFVRHNHDYKTYLRLMTENANEVWDVIAEQSPVLCVKTEQAAADPDPAPPEWSDPEWVAPHLRVGDVFERFQDAAARIVLGRDGDVLAYRFPDKSGILYVVIMPERDLRLISRAPDVPLYDVVNLGDKSRVCRRTDVTRNVDVVWQIGFESVRLAGAGRITRDTFNEEWELAEDDS